MITRVATRIGGALLTGALALACAGSVAARRSPQDQNMMWMSVDDDAPGWLGIRMDEVSSAKAKELKLPAERGALVTYVSDDSPAAKAGLKVNDVVTDFEGQRVESTMALQRMVREVPSGRTVTLNVWRDGHSQTVSVQIGSRRSSRFKTHDGNFAYIAPEGPESFSVETPIVPMPAMPAMPAIPSLQGFEWNGLRGMRIFGGPMLGIDAEDLSGQLGNIFGAPDGQGVLVREVMPGTPAEKAGLKAGDVIVRADGKRVTSTEDLRSIFRDAAEKADKSSSGADSEKAQTITSELSVLRSGKETSIRVELQTPKAKVRAARRVAV